MTPGLGAGQFAAEELTATQLENINPGNVTTLVWQHLLITLAVTVIVVTVHESVPTLTMPALDGAAEGESTDEATAADPN